MMDEEVITVDSSSEDDDDVLPIVPAPRFRSPSIGTSRLPTSPKQGVEIVHLTASKFGPKLKSRPKSATNSRGGNLIKNGCGTGTTSDDAITLSSDDDEESNNITQEIKKDTTTSRRRRGMQEQVMDLNDFDNEKPSSSKSGGSISSTTTTIPDEKNDEDAKLLLQDQDDDVKQDEGGGNNIGGNDQVVTDKSVSTYAENDIKQLLKVLYPRLSFGDRKRLRKKLEKKYLKLANEPLELHVELSKRINLVTNHMKQNVELNFWKLLSQLMDQFKSDTLKNGTFTISYADEELQIFEKSKEQRRIHLENYLVRICKKIKKLDEQDVDWSDEDDHNSSYMQRDRLMDIAIKAHNLICKIEKCSKFTGRPVQKAIRVKNTTMYPEVEQAVEKYVNSIGYSENPDFSEILSVVEKANVNLHLSESDRKELARTLHREVIERRKQLREMDLSIAFPVDPAMLDADDPADLDPELEERLKQNAKIGKTIRSVVDEFVQKEQEEKAAKAKSKTTNSVENEDKDLEEEEKDDDDEEEEEEDDSEESEESDVASIIKGGECFVTSVEDEEEACLAACDEPLFDDDENGDEQISSVSLPTDAIAGSSITEIVSEIESIIVNNGVINSDTTNDELKVSTSTKRTADDDESELDANSPSIKKIKLDDSSPVMNIIDSIETKSSEIE